VGSSWTRINVRETLRTAIIGCGFQGGLHAENVASHPRLDLVTCCDTDSERAALLASRWGAKAATEPSAVLSDPAIDAVVIASTTDSHAELAVEAARAGKHILLEKPMALDVEQCLEVERAVEAAQVALLIGFKFRFMATARRAKREVRAPIVLTAHTLYDASQTTAGWVNDRNRSGGRLMSSLVHSVDLLRYLAGSEVAHVTAVGGNLAIEGLSDIDNAAIALTFRNGAIASLIHGAAGASALLSVWSFQTAGLGVNATLFDHGRRLIVHNVNRTTDPIEHRVDVDNPYSTGMPELLDAFVTAVDRGHSAEATPRDGTMSVLICKAIERSIATGQPQSIDEPAMP
jgi:myo-inositol 2-dehydrogenase/D-chiro-inositol 1-dehydrogenase